MIETSKRCNQCHVVKPISEYPCQETGRPRGYCRDCKNRKQREKFAREKGMPKKPKPKEIRNAPKAERDALAICRTANALWRNVRAA